MGICIAQSMKFWNFNHNMCCNYHACLFEVRKICRSLEQRRCDSDFGGDGDGQCDTCGMLADLKPRPGRIQRCTVCLDGTIHATRDVVQL